MIFVGRGSLLWRAVRETRSRGHAIDLVCVSETETVPPDIAELPILRTANVNEDHQKVLAAATDDVMWSIDNGTILREPLLSSGLRIHNIHNGLLPDHRGLPEIAVIFALLRDAVEYGATLHLVDAGIDTGAVLDTERFDIAPEHGFQEVMLAGVKACHTLFVRNLDAVAAGTASPQPAASHSGEYFGRTRIADLARPLALPEFDPQRYERATSLGVFSPLYPEIAEAVSSFSR
ncbi:MAG: hypothetical protein GX542_12920 [Rhodococcus sp.]|nr:hypothetical protein [Rhodococcus sp. (in: high G+C Gram-positive bacteria)]